MALRAVFVLLFVLATFGPIITSAKDFIVGDQSGWTVGFDYQAWAAGKEFHIGDKLVFNYPVGEHNVYKVNGTDFQNCTVPLQGTPLTSGNDTIVLATCGKKWYICGVANHCSLGQKLVITVQPQALPPSIAPAHPPAWSYSRGTKRPFFHFNWP
ncbi:blue copper protein 1b-like [Mangifera indica]|uniref:blue copper protein 1b-like n=1 Tax=Mangifera indica TaxID=29780 RepID=UPI001CF9F3AE|nr:blue copper protein 1b-like [Mangifera indica]